MSNKFYGDAVVIDTVDTAGPVKLGSITSASIPLNTETRGDDGGLPYDYSRSIVSQMPVPTFSTKAIAAALAAITTGGICINVDGDHPGVSIFGRQRESCGDGEAVESDDHLEYLFDTGLIVPMTLTGSRGEDSILTVEIDALTDGTNAPFGIDYEATLPTSLDMSTYVLGHMRVGNILFGDCRDFNLAFNIPREDKVPQLGGVWADSVSTGKQTPIISLEGRNPKLLNDSTGIPLLGKGAVHAETIFYFKKRKNKSTFEADASTVHLKITAGGLLLMDNPFSTSGAAAATTSIRLEGVHDGTNVPIIVTPNVAYDPTP